MPKESQPLATDDFTIHRANTLFKTGGIFLTLGLGIFLAIQVNMTGFLDFCLAQPDPTAWAYVGDILPWVSLFAGIFLLGAGNRAQKSLRT